MGVQGPEGAGGSTASSRKGRQLVVLPRAGTHLEEPQGVGDLDSCTRGSILHLKPVPAFPANW